MVHKKYIKRGNKVFGPYLYENYREKGVIKTRYLGLAPEKKKFKLDKKFLIALLIVFFILTINLMIFIPENFSFKKVFSSKGELLSQKNFGVSVIVLGRTNYPPIINISEEFYVCENQKLGEKLNTSFQVSDPDQDEIELLITPYSFDPFYIVPFQIPKYGSPAQTEIKTDPIPLEKYYVNKIRISNQGWAVYREKIYAFDSLFSYSMNFTNITIIEINNAPDIEKIGVQTIWTRGENNVFYKKISVSDKEEGNEFNENLTIDLSFLDGKPQLFNISNKGIINATANNSWILSGNSTVYNLRYCVRDSDLRIISHKNISLCAPEGNASKIVCNDFSLTATNENRKPVITSYYPKELNFTIPGTNNLYFNITYYDPDGTIPDVYWYLDNQTNQYTTNSSYDEFASIFGCGTSGNHNIIVIVTDGLNSSEIQWNTTINYVECAKPSSGGGGGGGGGLFCSEKWACKSWGECYNLKQSYESKKIGKVKEVLIKSRCLALNYKQEDCGFQTRDCFDLSYCNKTLKKPGILKECLYTLNPNCDDGIKNCHNGSCEILIDCGGPCKECPNCEDGVKNQGETGIDCGGPCKACPIEKPFSVSDSNIFILFISFSLILLLVILLILFLILTIYEIRRYILFKKMIKKNIKKNFNKKKLNLLLFIFIIIIIVLLVNVFIIKNMNINRIVIDSKFEQGILSSYGLSEILTKSIAKFLMFNILQTITTSSGDTTLTIWSDTDDTAIKKYTFCNSYCSDKGKTEETVWNTYFYANYSYQNNPITSTNGNCSIMFNEDLILNKVNYNSSNNLWEYNRSFVYRGNRNYNISCTSSYANLTIPTTAFISSSPPYIMTTGVGKYTIDVNLTCKEDIPCYYDFNTNISNDDQNAILNYGYYTNSNTTLTNFTINSANGILTINVTDSKYSGADKQIELNVNDPETLTKSALLKVNIQNINDPPIFVNLNNKSFNMSEIFEYLVYITDEENNIPFNLTIDFISCSTAPWSDRQSTNCILFSESQSSFNKDTGILSIIFTPSENDVGSYIINFSVTDNNTKLGNAQTSQIVNFTVSLINKPPVFTYVCDNERNTIEDSLFNCWINATDIYETNNLTFISDQPWFLNKTISSCDFSTSYNASVKISFTPNDINVGNWSINVTVIDTGNPVKANSTIINFFVENINDPVNLNNMEDFIGYTENEYYISINASDDDLKIPISTNPGVYKENLTFYAKNESGSDISWIKIVYDTIDKNKGIGYARLNVSTKGLPNGNYYINLSVQDANYFSLDSQVFYINIGNNNPPLWNSSFIYDYYLNEDNNFLLNLTNAVKDADGDILNFYFENYSEFNSFNINEDIISFTPIDEDVGFHVVKITANDGKTPSSKEFRFSINNSEDIPKITYLIVNGRLEDNEISAAEDNLTEIFLFVHDEDFKIPLTQRNFYNESLNINLTIQGPNETILSFIKNRYYPPQGSNLSKFDAVFTPKKFDLGKYNITINITDKNNLSDVLYINLTITGVQHSPILINITNHTSKINLLFYLDINAIDLEDINDTSGNLTYSYSFFSDGNLDFIENNESIFNSTYGQLNYTFNSSAKYHLNMTVTDSTNLNDTKNFWIFVYGNPIITYPNPGCQFNLKENSTSNLTIRAYHYIENNLTYEIYLNNSLSRNLSYYGNNTNLTLEFIPSFTDETYGILNNLRFLVLNPIYHELNDSLDCSVNISHTNAPVIFTGWIGDKSTTYNNQIAIDLKDYFSDIDHTDFYYNQTIDFKISSANISSRIDSNWTLYLSSNKPIKEIININAKDSEYNATSNNFIIEFTDPSVITIQTPTPSSGGGGGQSSIIFIKLVFPGQISAYQNDKIVIPLSIINKGTDAFNNVKLTSFAFKGKDPKDRVMTSLTKDFFNTIKKDSEEKLNLTVYFNGTKKIGDYEVFINLTSESPRYNDWGKIHINLQAINKSKIQELLKFTEELIVKNPECIEVREILNEAESLRKKSDFSNAELKVQEAIDACKNSISQVSIPRKNNNFYFFGLYLFLAILSSIIMGIIYYLVNKKKIIEPTQLSNIKDEKSSYS